MIHACRRKPSFIHVQVGHDGHEGGKMGVDGQGGRSGNSGRVGLVGLLLLFILMLLSKVAIIGFVDSPRHMVLAPIKGIFPNFLPFLALPRLGRLFLPCLIFLLFPFV
jgi:hypothetical protein